jgi:hypothetical protein
MAKSRANPGSVMNLINPASRATDEAKFKDREISILWIVSFLKMLGGANGLSISLCNM